MKKEVISSISYSQDEILANIIKLYCPVGFFDCDPTYSKGNFYKVIPKPLHKFDIVPQTPDTFKSNSEDLPLSSNCLNSIVFDPPFMFGIHGQTKNNIMTKRFTMYKDFEELHWHYWKSLREFNRVLKKNGILVFKCQDYTDSTATMTHCLVYAWAEEWGFEAVDLFILLSKGRIFNPKLTQRHSRKFHAYFWVFKKKVNI